MRAMRSAIFVLAVLSAGSAAADAKLAPHRAVYDLSLDDASDQSGVTGLSGRMVYEFGGSSCDGYTVTFRFVTQIDTEDATRISDMQTTSYEAGDGSSFDFANKSFIDQTLDKEVKGRARNTAEATTVSLQKPEAKELSLAKTQFPTKHLEELIGKAKSGERFYETTLFDGSEDADRVMTTTVVVGKQEPVTQADPERSAMGKLAEDTFWPVEIAYFDLTEEEEVPSYRISFRLHENGLTRDLLMDYGDFSMSGRLVKLELLEQPAENCSR